MSTGFVRTEDVRVLVDATTGDIRLDHPEGVAVHSDGSIWCGGEHGQIYRLRRDGTGLEQVASTDGFCLGLAFDVEDNLYICDLHHRAVMRMDHTTGRVEIFADGVPGHRFRLPNFPLFDENGRLYVSDSWSMGEPGPGIARFTPAGGGELWYKEALHFANGLALSATATEIYVAETFAQRVSVIPVAEDGSAGARRTHALTPGSYPDGLAVDSDGDVWVGCYEPSQVLRITGGDATIAYHDETAHLLAHPTNLAFHGTSLVTANLGRWHLSVLEIGKTGRRVPATLRAERRESGARGHGGQSTADDGSLSNRSNR